MKESYGLMRDAYQKIFNAIGFDYRIVSADSGAIGGSASEEFHVLADSGEDKIVFSEDELFASNLELFEEKSDQEIIDQLHKKDGKIYSIKKVIEVGHINFSPTLQRTTEATEAMFLMMRWAFEAGYRRYEWKCNALNLKSRKAAQRLGLSYEGVFRQATMTKGRNRDTAWFAAIDKEWPGLKARFEQYLSSKNFTNGGVPRVSLTELNKHHLYKEDNHEFS